MLCCPVHNWYLGGSQVFAIHMWHSDYAISRGGMWLLQERKCFDVCTVVKMDTHSVRMIVNRARQLCSGIHKVQEEGVGQGIHGDELHWTKVVSTAGVISGLLPGTEKAGEDL
jgi:hypothetical protein